MTATVKKSDRFNARFYGTLSSLCDMIKADAGDFRWYLEGSNAQVKNYIVKRVQPEVESFLDSDDPDAEYTESIKGTSESDDSGDSTPVIEGTDVPDETGSVPETSKCDDNADELEGPALTDEVSSHDKTFDNGGRVGSKSDPVDLGIQFIEVELT